MPNEINGGRPLRFPIDHSPFHRSKVKFQAVKVIPPGLPPVPCPFRGLLSKQRRRFEQKGCKKMTSRNSSIRFSRIL